VGYWSSAYRRARWWADEHEREAHRSRGQVAEHEATAAAFWQAQAEQAAAHVWAERMEEGT
jgi:hypothetical protein